eukprot:scaffold645_cov247-Pinguiococcus_pyrenoidosus.AAC.1
MLPIPGGAGFKNEEANPARVGFSRSKTAGTRRIGARPLVINALLIFEMLKSKRSAEGLDVALKRKPSREFKTVGALIQPDFSRSQETFII